MDDDSGDNEEDEGEEELISKRLTENDVCDSVCRWTSALLILFTSILRLTY